MLMSISSEPDAYGTSGTDDRLLSSVVCHLGRTLPRLDRPRKAMVCPTVPPPSLLRAVSECLVGFGAFPRLPGQRIILAAVARPGVERVDHVLQFRRQLRHGAQQHPLQWRHLLAMAVGRAFLHLDRPGTVVLYPVQAQRGIELRAKTRGEEAVAEEPPRGVQRS